MSDRRRLPRPATRSTRVPRPPRSPRARRPATRRALAAAQALLLGTALTALTAACSSGHTQAPTASDVTSAHHAHLRAGGTLRWAVDDVPATFNTFQPDADDATTTVAEAVLPHLFTLDAHGKASPDPDYLASAKVVSTSPQTVEYRLNPKAVWSDGKPLSAADFTAQWHALRGTDQSYWAAGTDGYDDISSIAPGSDPHTVRVVFAKPYAAWQRLFSPLYPAAAMNSPHAFSDGSRGRLAATAGPFTLASVDRKAGQIRLARNPRWWGQRPALDALDLEAVPAAKRLAAVKAGRLDVADLSQAIEDDGTPVSEAAHLPGFTLHRAAAPAYEQLTLNGGSGALADPGLRRAVATAIDRGAIASAALGPLGLSTAPLGNHLVMADQQGYADDSSALGGGLPQAQKMLEAAGWSAGADAAQQQAAKGDAAQSGAHTKTAADAGTAAKGQAGAKAGASGASAQSAALTAAGLPVRVKAGKPLALNLIVPAGSAGDRKIADLVAHQLGEAGIATAVKPVDSGKFFSDSLAAGDFDLALFSWSADPYPVADEVPLYAKPTESADGTLDRGQNAAAVGTDQIDQLLDQAEHTLDAKQAAELTRRADSRIWALAPNVPLYQRAQLVAVRDGVAGAGAYGFATPDFAALGFTR